MGNAEKTIDSPANRHQFRDLVAVHYQGCDLGDLDRATSMMLEDVRFTLPALGQCFTNRKDARAGLAKVITRLPRMMRHRPAGFLFSTADSETLRVQFTTHIMSCVTGKVHAIGDITVDAVERGGALVVRAWEVQPIYFRGLISAGTLARLPRLLLTLAPFLLPREVRALFRAAAGQIRAEQ